MASQLENPIHPIKKMIKEGDGRLMSYLASQQRQEVYNYLVAFYELEENKSDIQLHLTFYNRFIEREKYVVEKHRRKDSVMFLLDEGKKEDTIELGFTEFQAIKQQYTILKDNTESEEARDVLFDSFSKIAKKYIDDLLIEINSIKNHIIKDESKSSPAEAQHINGSSHSPPVVVSVESEKSEDSSSEDESVICCFCC